jgi:hypothetical protein
MPSEEMKLLSDIKVDSDDLGERGFIRGKWATLTYMGLSYNEKINATLTTWAKADSS